MSELRRKMLTDLRIRNYAERTQQAYIARVAEMARDLGRSPDALSGEEVREYLRYLKEERGVSRSWFAQVLSVSPTLPSTQRIRFRRSRGFAVQLLVELNRYAVGGAAFQAVSDSIEG